MRTFIPVLVLLLCGACVSQKSAQPATSTGTRASATPAPAKHALTDSTDVVNDAAGAAAVLSVPSDVASLPPALATKPAEKAFRHLLVLHDMTARRVLATMHGMARALSDHCSACHVEHDFPSDQKPEKRMARRMLLLAQQLNARTFRGHVAITCWTCHRGDEHPESAPANLEQHLAAMKLPGALPAVPPDAKRADDVYKNLKVLGGLPPQRLIPAMKTISASLGVSCDACHVPGEWASDAKHMKKTARRMMRMAMFANAQLFGTDEGDAVISCWTCHRGSKHPQRLPPKTAH